MSDTASSVPTELSYWRRLTRGQAAGILRQLVSRKTALFGLFILTVISLGAIFAPVVAPYDPYELHVDDALTPPSSKYFFGTDETGRDLFSIMLFGARISLLIGLAAETIAVAIGMPLGLLAGYFGKVVDDIIMRVLDGLLAFPGILLALVIVAVLGVSMTNLTLAIGLINMPYMARIARAAMVVEKERDYVLAARSIGATNQHIIARNILPNCLAPLIVQATLGIAIAILSEAALSFLGLGVQPPAASWGTLLNVGYSYIHMTPWYVAFPGLAIFLVVWAFNLLGDGLRDALDPRLRKG